MDWTTIAFNNMKAVLPLFATLFVCVGNGYSMCSYRIPKKKAYACFLLVTVACLVINSYIVISYGRFVFRDLMLYTVALPYFVLILLISKDKPSQTFFTFWLWINVYSVIFNLAMFVNEVTVKNYKFEVVLRILLLCGYFVLYHKFLKKSHRLVIEKLNVNWWLFSVIPFFFTVLVVMINRNIKEYQGFSRHYPILFVIFLLMGGVYLLIAYTFRVAYTSREKELIAQNLKDQMQLQKKQYEMHTQAIEKDRIFRHDQRFRNSMLMNLLECGDIEEAKEVLQRELAEVEKKGVVPFCKNAMINAVLVEYGKKAEMNGITYTVRMELPEELLCDEVEFCVMLSNLLENSLDAAITYITVQTKNIGRQIFLNIENDYDGELKKDDDGWYMTTKQGGSGLGLKSADAMFKAHQGSLILDVEDGVFHVYASMRNE